MPVLVKLNQYQISGTCNHRLQSIMKCNEALSIVKRDEGIERNRTYCDTRFFEVKTHGKGLPHEDVGVVTGLERPFQFFQLPRAEVGPRPPPLTRRVIQIRIYCTSNKHPSVVNDSVARITSDCWVATWACSLNSSCVHLECGLFCSSDFPFWWSNKICEPFDMIYPINYGSVHPGCKLKKFCSVSTVTCFFIQILERSQHMIGLIWSNGLVSLADLSVSIVRYLGRSFRWNIILPSLALR